MFIHSYIHVHITYMLHMHTETKLSWMEEPHIHCLWLFHGVHIGYRSQPIQTWFPPDSATLSTSCTTNSFHWETFKSQRNWCLRICIIMLPTTPKTLDNWANSNIAVQHNPYTQWQANSGARPSYDEWDVTDSVFCVPHWMWLPLNWAAYLEK